MEEDQIRENVTKLKICKVMGPERLPPQMLRELADIIASRLSNIFVTSEQLGEVPEDWERANASPVVSKTRRKMQGATGCEASLQSLGRFP